MSEANLTTQLIDLINPLIASMGYEVVHLEVLLSRQKVLRVFIDFTTAQDGKAIGIEDCVKVTRALDEPLDQLPEIEKLFHGNYELEVSSPGVDRPLRTGKDFERFKGREARIHTFRPLTADETGNAAYQSRYPKQKNFLGTLQGFRNERVVLAITPFGKADGKTTKKAQKKSKAAADGNTKGPASLSTNSADEVCIPLPLISKANLEPTFDFGDESESKV